MLTTRNADDVMVAYNNHTICFKILNYVLVIPLDSCVSHFNPFCHDSTKDYWLQYDQGNWKTLRGGDDIRSSS